MYLYDLNHFHKLEEDEAKHQQQQQQPDPDANPLLPKIPDELQEHNLVVDAGQEVSQHAVCHILL
jgi:hypothetical protein